MVTASRAPPRVRQRARWSVAHRATNMTMRLTPCRTSIGRTRPRAALLLAWLLLGRETGKSAAEKEGALTTRKPHGKATMMPAWLQSSTADFSGMAAEPIPHHDNDACPANRSVASARFRIGGRLAQLVEHLVYTERVGGSSPSAPTIASTCQSGCTRRSNRPRSESPRPPSCGSPRSRPTSRETSRPGLNWRTRSKSGRLADQFLDQPALSARPAVPGHRRRSRPAPPAKPAVAGPARNRGHIDSPTIVTA